MWQRVCNVLWENFLPLQEEVHLEALAVMKT